MFSPGFAHTRLLQERGPAPLAAPRAPAHDWRPVTDDGARLDLRDLRPAVGGCVPGFGLAPDGEALVLARSGQQRLFLRVVDPASGRVRAGVSLSAPRAVGEVLDLAVEDETVRVVTGSGLLLAIDRRTWTVRTWRDLTTLLAPDQAIDLAFLVPGRPRLWLQTTGPGHWDRDTVVVDTERGRLRPGPPAPNGYDLFGHPGDALVLSSAYDQTMETAFDVLDPGGELTAWRGVDAGAPALAAQTHPGGERLVVLHELFVEAYQTDGPLALSVLDRGGQLGRPYVFARSSGMLPFQLGTSRSTGRVHVVRQVDGEDTVLLHTLRPYRDRLKEVDRREVPRHTELVGDTAAERLVAVAPTDDGLQVVALDGEPRTFASSATPRAVSIPRLDAPLGCCGFHRRQTPGEIRLLGGNGDISRRRMRRHRDAHPALAAGLDLYWALVLRGQEAEAREQAAWLGRGDPEALWPRLLDLRHHAVDRDWTALRDACEALTGDALEPTHRAHIAHLHGLALLHTGDPEDAAAVWRGGLTAHDRCGLLSALVAIGAEPGAPEHAPLRRLVGALLAAEAARTPADVVAALDVALVWRARELQTLARLADAMLSLPASTVRRAVALSAFCDAHERVGLHRHELPAPGIRWDRDRLERLASRVRAALAGDAR